MNKFLFVIAIALCGTTSAQASDYDWHRIDLPGVMFRLTTVCPLVDEAPMRADGVCGQINDRGAFVDYCGPRVTNGKYLPADPLREIAHTCANSKLRECNFVSCV
jgi:hypothetical protein